MRLLVLTPYYYPYINPRAFRWTSIARHWAERGHEVHVICSSRDGWEPESIDQGVHMHRVGFNSLKEIFYYYSNAKNRRGEANTSTNKINGPSWKNRILLSLNERFWKPFYWPDDAFIWYRPALKKARNLLGNYQFDGVITVSLPFTTHCVGLELKKEYPAIPWLADIGDPFSIQKVHPLNNTKFYWRKNKKYEQRVLDHADRVAVTNGGMVKIYQNAFNLPGHKCLQIPPLCSINLDNSELYSSKTTNDFHLGYFGSFFKGVRDPALLLAFFSKFNSLHPAIFNRLTLHFYGDIFENFQPIFQRFPEVLKNSHFHGLLGREIVGGAMAKMDVLINLGNKSSFQLPSKSADYLASGRPIVNFSQISEDTTRLFFKNHPLFLDIPLPSSDQSTKALSEFLQKVKGQELDSNWVAEAIQPYKVKTIAHQYERFFQTDK